MDATVSRQVLHSSQFDRTQFDLFGRANLILARFPDAGGASCCFVRVLKGETKAARFVLPGLYELQSCLSGGWLIKPVEVTAPSYWIPQFPVLREFDSRGFSRNGPLPLVGFKPSLRGIDA